MKTSNILLTTLIGGITIYILAAFGEIAIKGESNDEISFNTSREDLPPFTYISANNINFNLQMAQTPALEIQTREGREPLQLTYHVANDTLFLEAPNQEGANSGSTLYAHEEIFKGLILENCRVNFTVNHSIDTLEVRSSKSNLTTNTGNNNLNNLVIHATNESLINFQDLNTVNEVTVHSSQNSRIGLYNGTILKLNGSISEQSELTAQGVSEFNFIKDAGSRLNSN